MQKAILTLRLIALAFSVVLCLASWAEAHHTVFSYQVDRFQGDGNLMGPHDGVFDVEDDFDDGLLCGQSLDSRWCPSYGTVFETGGFLFLTNPGVHWTGTNPPLLDLSIATGVGPNYGIMMAEGEGDFTGIAYWEPIIPEAGHHYHFSVVTWGVSDGGDILNEEAFGTGIRMKRDRQLYIEQHLLEVDETKLAMRQLMLDHFPISAGDITGRIVFRLDFDDSTNLATSSFSLDGGTTWESPFPPVEIFVGGTNARFILSADPEADESTTTTTTTTSASSTTTTTLATPGQQMKMGKLLLVKNASPANTSKRKIVYSVKEPASSNTIVGDPMVNGAKLKVRLDANTDCYDMPAGGWSAIGTLGFKYKDATGAYGPVKLASIKKTPSGIFLMKAKITGRNGPITVIPPDPGIQADTNFSLGGGDEYCSTFGGSIGPNDDKTFKATNAPAPTVCNVTACSPSGAFLDMPSGLLD